MIKVTVSKQKVLIVGGGITGLTSAYYLQKHARENNEPIEVVLVEAGLRVGGKIHTIQKDGFVIERGPESFHDRRGSVGRLAEDLQIKDQLVYSNQFGSTYIAVRNQLYRIPISILRGGTISASEFLTSGLFTLSGKFRAAGDLVMPRSSLASDQPVGDFFKRRFGAEVLANLIEPLLAGTFAGDVEKLSLQSTFPEFFSMERQYRSLLLGMKKQGARAFIPSKGEEEKTVFQSFKNGLQQLVDSLENSLSTGTILKGVKVESVEKESDGSMSVYFNNAAPMKVDHIIFAAPYTALHSIFSKQQLLQQLPPLNSATIATVTMAFEKEQLNDLDATTIFAARNSDFSITSCTFSHRKWSNVAPKGKALIRTYIGRVGDEAIVELSDNEIEKTVLQDLNKLINLKGAPLTTVVARWKQAMPQYTVGHAEWFSELKAELQQQFPHIYVAGSSYDGISVPECVEQGQRTVEKLLCKLLVTQ